MSDDPQAVPSVGRLFAEAFGRLAGQPRSFWPMALICTAGLAVVKFLVLTGIASSGLSAVVAAVYVLLLHQWFQQFLLDDPKARAATPSWSFIGFAAGYCLLVAALSVVLFLFLAPDVFGGRLTENILLMSTVSLAAAMVVGALAFGGALLFLPGSIAGLPWNPGDAWRAAAGGRTALLALALLCTLVSLVGPALSLPLGQASGWVQLAVQLLSILLDTVALYVLAAGVTRVFLARTGWRPGETALRTA